MIPLQSQLPAFPVASGNTSLLENLQTCASLVMFTSSGTSLVLHFEKKKKKSHLSWLLIQLFVAAGLKSEVPPPFCSWHTRVTWMV